MRFVVEFLYCQKMMDQDSKEYKGIFKSTFLFGFVQVFNILVKVGLNKVVAKLLGTEGLGLIGLFNSTINTIQTGAGLGISQSAVRDISEANKQNDFNRFSRVINVTNRVILFTSLLGVIVTILLSPLLSKAQFGDYSYILSFVWLSIVVGLNVLTDGQLAILKGMRQLRSLAKASMIGSVVGFVTAVPFYFFFGKGGIIPSLIIAAFSALFFSNYFVRKIKYNKAILKLKEVLSDSKEMVKMGISLMMVTFLGYFFDLIISSFISSYGSLSDVGLYHAGTTIITSYFGIVITAMSTDYYPRICAVHKDNTALQGEMNRQSETGLILIFPLVVLFVFLSPFIIELIYSKDFAPTNMYTDYAMIGTVIIVVSNCMGMILLAKQASKIFLVSVISQRIILIGVYILAYMSLGILGLGFSYICTGVIHFLFMTFILNRFYNIRLSKRTFTLLILVIIITIMTVFVRKIDYVILKYVLGSLLFVFSCVFSLIYMNKVMDLNILQIVKSKLKK